MFATAWAVQHHWLVTLCFVVAVVASGLATILAVAHRAYEGLLIPLALCATAGALWILFG